APRAPPFEQPRRATGRSGRAAAPGGSLNEDLELDAAVLLAPRLGVVRGDRAILAEALGLEAIGVDALVDQVLADRLGAALREIAVELVGALGRGVALDEDDEVLVLEEDRGGGVEHREGRRLDDVRVDREGDASDGAGVLLDDLLGRRRRA